MTERRKLLIEASIDAAGKLGEVEARSHVLDDIHHGTPEVPTVGCD